MSRWLVLTTLIALVVAVTYGWLTYGGMVIIDLAVLVFSLAYQLGVLPWEIRRNWKARAVNKMSYGFAFVGAASYLFSTVRALIQPDWVDVASRWWGMIGSLIITIQIIYYDKVRLSLDPPYLIRRAFDIHTDENIVTHMTTAHCRPCKLDSDHVAEWPVRCKCGGNLHFIDVESYNANHSIHLYTGKCDRCNQEFKLKKISHNPYPDGSTFWVRDDDEAPWRCVSHVEYIDLIGDDIAYSVKGAWGLVAAPGTTPTEVDTDENIRSLIAIMAHTRDEVR